MCVGGARRLPADPDLPDLRHAVLPAVGPRDRARPAAVVHGLRGTDRASAGGRLGRRDVDLRQRRAAPRRALRDRLVPAARLGRLPAHAHRVLADRRGDRGRAAADALQLHVPRRPRLRRPDLLRRDRLGGGVRDRAAAAGDAGLRRAAGRRADPTGRLAAGRPLLAVVRAARRAGPSALRWARSSPPGRCIWVGARLDRDRAAAALADQHAEHGGRARAHGAARSAARHARRTT